MENFKPENYGERWINYIVQQNWGKHWHFIFLVFAVFFGYFSIQHINSFSPTIPVMFFLLAGIYFERWHFSNILRRQQAQIESLRAELKTTFPGAEADSHHHSS
jgi:hypothetical protein